MTAPPEEIRTHGPLCRYCARRRSGGRIRRLDRRVELSGIAALLARPVAGAFAAAEGHVVVHARGRQVHHHHTGLHVALEMRGVLEGGRGNAGGETEHLRPTKSLRRLATLYRAALQLTAFA